MKRVLVVLIAFGLLTGCRSNEKIPCQEVPRLTGMETARVVRVDVCDSNQQCAVVIQRRNGDWAYVGVDGLIRENQLIFRGCSVNGESIQKCDPVWSNHPTYPHADDIAPVNEGEGNEPSDSEL